MNKDHVTSRCLIRDNDLLYRIAVIHGTEDDLKILRSAIEYGVEIESTIKITWYSINKRRRR